MIQLKTEREIETIARGGAIIADLFKEIGPRVQPGVSTGELDRFSDEFICSHQGATPAFKGLYGFPGSVCASVNEEVVHGIPSFRRKLKEGDILSIDVGVRLDGWCSDSAWTFPVGEVNGETRDLLRVTEEALYVALEAAVVGNHVGDIGAAVVARVEGTGYGIIRDLVGHGLGREVHEEPQVPNVGKPGHGPPLREGMVLAIEPMLSAGTDQIRTLADRWTVATADRTRSAHFEHTIALTRDGPQVLTGSVPDGYRVLPGPGVIPEVGGSKR
ncbi:MAG: type I methionyl aminopeptidase [Gemmatimonadales bacterium]|nr:MAG: type I methionyl aminopeptidase [Gemmatimonadales bacterium]